MTPEQKSLIEIAQMLADQEIAKLGVQKAQTHKIGTQIEHLRAVEMLRPEEGAPRLQVMGNAWGDWRRREISSLNLELAKSTLLEETAKQKARRALGRRIALGSIFGEEG